MKLLQEMKHGRKTSTHKLKVNLQFGCLKMKNSQPKTIGRKASVVDSEKNDVHFTNTDKKVMDIFFCSKVPMLHRSEERETFTVNYYTYICQDHKKLEEK